MGQYLQPLDPSEVTITQRILIVAVYITTAVKVDASNFQSVSRSNLLNQRNSKAAAHWRKKYDTMAQGRKHSTTSISNINNHEKGYANYKVSN
ncbi:hypothetical protein QVD17_15633 [Tagetes erecta]|uniref:Uncharacterized protein n=1 Tax=Tagetes erecta TaxID=13708 RepID=A0AAD8KTN5_TARER|nr:hypothetical protein QVD17_15633 [Tagetes erecta]